MFTTDFKQSTLVVFVVCCTTLAAMGQKFVTAPGVTQPFQDVTVSTPVPGTITARLIKEGEFIKQGQTLIELKKQQEELEVKRRKIVLDSTAEAQAAKAKVETLKVDVESTRELFKASKSVSKDELAKKELEYKQAVAEVDRLASAKEREIVEYEMSREILRERSVRSPLDGYVVELFESAGEDCKAQDPLVRVVDTRQFYFVSNVEAKIGYQLKVGQPLRIEVEAGRKIIPVAGKITFVSPVVDPASGLLKIKVLCDNADGAVRPGVSGNVFLPEE